MTRSFIWYQNIWSSDFDLELWLAFQKLQPFELKGIVKWSHASWQIMLFFDSSCQNIYSNLHFQKTGLYFFDKESNQQYHHPMRDVIKTIYREETFNTLKLCFLLLVVISKQTFSFYKYIYPLDVQFPIINELTVVEIMFENKMILRSNVNTFCIFLSKLFAYTVMLFMDNTVLFSVLSIS